MSILDDAIREHLELKRSHGASEDEVRRQETEVFGPARAGLAAEPGTEAPGDEHTQLLTPDSPTVRTALKGAAAAAAIGAATAAAREVANRMHSSNGND